VLLVISPQPSIIILCTNYYYIVRRSLFLLCLHLFVSYFLIFMMMSSLIVTLARDPGPIRPLEAIEGEDAARFSSDQRDEMSLTEALLPENVSIPVKANGEPRWCRKCWAPKPERTHHCSECNRCVLKMDHHCPWLANRCVGARTYPSFLHFLFSTTLYSTYQFWVAAPAVWYYLDRPFILDETDYTPFHALTIALLAAIFTLTVGPFFIYHVYLTCTNQTTIETLHPYMLLSYLAPSVRLPRIMGPILDDPYRFPSPPPRRWVEHGLNSKQRMLVREAAGRIRIYDLGWRENIWQTLGGPDPSQVSFSKMRIWTERMLWGGRG
ncbi:DHHC palmitoyltransferase-domain-containing protein, partial [Cantharellus anzutake]|uniref:DHHC palmitoyltransferase-domain-containing protein n=1 Tax=Cantharellus anzutake TaxID=1750568 RepID=UPI001905A405